MAFCEIIVISTWVKLLCAYWEEGRYLTTRALHIVERCSASLKTKVLFYFNSYSLGPLAVFGCCAIRAAPGELLFMGCVTYAHLVLSLSWQAAQGEGWALALLPLLRLTLVVSHQILYFIIVAAAMWSIRKQCTLSTASCSQWADVHSVSWKGVPLWERL